MSRRHANVVNLDEVSAASGPKVGSFASELKPLAREAGARALGCTHHEVPPGQAAFPFHWHSANEEAAYVLEGTGLLRIGAEEVAVRAGDWISFPVGPDHSHQLRNTGTGPLRYLCVSTKQTPEICGYPDSKKYGIAAMGGDKLWVRALFFEEDGKGYFEREPDAEPK
jgi:uncharacterized cupin superfamily protein